MDENDATARIDGRSVQRLALPTLPVFGWDTFSGGRDAPTPCILDMPNICYTTSGRAAIGLALRLLDVGPGHRVLVPTYHCPTMIAPVAAAGAQPQFFSIDASGAPQIDALRSMDTSGTRAMIAAHYFGIPQAMAPVRAFCDERGIALIEDCAHSIFGSADGRPVGQWGDYAIASLTKFFPVVEGGCLVSRDPAMRLPELRRQPLARQVRSMTNTLEIGARHRRLRGLNGVLIRAFDAAQKLRGSREASAARSAATSKSREEAWIEEFAAESVLECMATRWTRWCVGRAHRERVAGLRRRNYGLLAGALSNVPGVKPLRAELPEGAVPYVFPVEVDRPESVYQTVRAAGIPVFRWDDAWPTGAPIRGDQGTIWATRVFQLGCHQDLGSLDIARLADALKAIVQRAREAAEPAGRMSRSDHSTGVGCP